MVRLPYYFVSFLLLSALHLRAAEPDAPPPVEQNVLQALPKVPTMATIMAEGNPKLQPGKWVQDLIQKKETKARVEIVLMKQKILAEQDLASTEEKERARRVERYNASFRGPGEGALPTASRQANKKKALHLKLEFQVAEIETYRRLVEAYKIRATLAVDIVDALTRIDRDGDGKLAGDEYRDAAFIFLATQRLFHAIDNDEDGYFTAAEIETARTLPANGTAAIAAGSATKEASTSGYRIKDFDANSDGVLSVAERKALSSAYLEISLKAKQEAEAYQKLIDTLGMARVAAAAKFENLTIESDEK